MKIQTWSTKQKIKDGKRSCKKFYFTTERNTKYTRGYNILVRVFSLTRDGQPLSIGTVEANTASYPGNIGMAVSLIGQIFGYKNDGYSISRNDVKIYEM